MSATTRASVLAERLPVALSEGPAVLSLLGALGAELEGADRAIFRLFRSRHVRQADHWWGDQPPKGTDLGRLCGLIGLGPQPGERSAAFRDRALALMAVHRAGLGTAEAVLRLAGLALRLEGRVDFADGLPGGTWAPVVHGQLRSGGRLHPVRLELLDNPPTARALRVAAWRHRQAIEVESLGVVPAPLEIRLRASAEMVAPMVRCGRAAALYAGVVPPGALLQLRPDGARIDGFAAPAPLIGLAVDVLGEQSEGPRFALPVPLAEALRLSPGRSRWTLAMVSPGAARALAEEAGLPCTLSGEDEPCEAVPAGELLWQDSTAASFTLRIPDLLPDWARDRAELGAALRAALDYGRAAGVRAQLELHVQIRDEGVVPEERAPGLTLGLRSDVSVEERTGVTAELKLQERYTPRERRFLQVEETLFQVFTDEDGTPREGFKLDEALLGRAPEARFDPSELAPTGAVRLNRDALALAEQAVFGASRWDKVALAWPGEAADADLTLHPDDPRVARVSLALGDEDRPWAEQPASRLDHTALSLAQPARFERGPDGKELGLKLDHVALAFALQAGALGRLRLGRAGFTASSTWVPPEGWPEAPRVARVHIEIDEALESAANTENIDVGEDNG